jgi:hypothetical protein
VSFLLRKLPHIHQETEHYRLEDLDLNDLLGKEITITHTGRILCLSCGADTRKSFGDGLCYKCFKTLARADSCIIRPHTCHYHQGTCREPAWGDSHCMIPHVVYLAQTSGLKVGVTGEHKVFERWGDQGARAAIVLAVTPDRKTAGEIERELSQHLSDRTNWRQLITGKVDEVDLLESKKQAIPLIPAPLDRHVSDDTNIELFTYPVLEYPKKAKTISLDKSSEIHGPLMGVVGQYLFLGPLAFNVRRHSGYEVDLKVAS